MTNEELNILKNIVEEFYIKLKPFQSSELYGISKYLTDQYILLKRLHDYEQTVLKYNEMQNVLIPKK